ncbi:DUF192 domain-containing protein [Candidatus Uhrbacteria bacterium]|nr:DUF192 domain-containing protein [Candidatus Uhrbacteria bacterium]
MRALVKAIAIIAVAIIASAGYVYFARQFGGDGRRRAPASAVFAERATVRIPAANYTARVEVARTNEDRQQGLSDRAALPSGTGLLMVFDQPDTFGIWMPRMRFSIDVIWISTGAVVDVTERLPIPPRGETYLPIFRPKVPALLALEVPAGTVATAGIREGQRVEVVFDGG